MADKTLQCSVSLYENQVKKIKNYKNQNDKKFKSDASVFQYIIDSFFEDENTKIRNMLITSIGYPVVLCIVTWWVFWQTSKLNTIVVGKGIYFHDLYILNGVTSILSFAMVGWLFASIYLLYYKWQKLTKRYNGG